MQYTTILMQALVAVSIFFVWVVRYDNIVKEFKHYGYSDGLRDFVGILKLTYTLMLLIGIERSHIAVVGGIGIALLTVAAFATHLRVKSPSFKMMPRLTLVGLSAVIAFLDFRMLNP